MKEIETHGGSSMQERSEKLIKVSYSICKEEITWHIQA
jgi:hypothetical protein